MVPKKVTSVDRRSDRRYPYACDVELLPSAPSLDNAGNGHVGRGIVLNVSTGGACILAANCSVEPFSVLPWKFQFPSVPVRVPVLAQVRWIEPGTAADERVRIGLLFLA
jgi:hypothetical protein